MLLEDELVDALKNDVYVVVAYRWGERDNHTYTVGVFDDEQAAIKCAEEHTIYRGGKYKCVVEWCIMNEVDHASDNYTFEIHVTETPYHKE